MKGVRTWSANLIKYGGYDLYDLIAALNIELHLSIQPLKSWLCGNPKTRLDELLGIWTLNSQYQV